MNVRRTSRPATGRDAERGAALVLALAVMVAISVILSALLTLLSSGVGSTIALQDRRNAQYAADGAMERTINFLATDSAPSGTRALIGSGCGDAPSSYVINGKTVEVFCIGEPIAVIIPDPTPSNPQPGLVLQRNVVISACVDKPVCNADTATIVAKVNFPTGANGTPAGAFIQSWSVTG